MGQHGRMMGGMMMGMMVHMGLTWIVTLGLDAVFVYLLISRARTRRSGYVQRMP